MYGMYGGRGGIVADLTHRDTNKVKDEFGGYTD